jgi:hypothetical protein
MGRSRHRGSDIPDALLRTQKFSFDTTAGGACGSRKVGIGSDRVVTVRHMLAADTERNNMTETGWTVIEVPADSEEAVRRLRAELRAAKRRRSARRRDAMFASYRMLWLGGANVNGR